MILEQWFVYLAVGAVLIFVWRKSPYSRWLSKKSTFLKELQDCNLCIGFWFYFILAIVMQINIFTEFYLIVVNQFLSAVVTAFFFYVLHAGWDTLFRNIVITGSE
jgi:hypothetical protein